MCAGRRQSGRSPTALSSKIAWTPAKRNSTLLSMTSANSRSISTDHFHKIPTRQKVRTHCLGAIKHEMKSIEMAQEFDVDASVSDARASIVRLHCFCNGRRPYSIYGKDFRPDLLKIATARSNAAISVAEPHTKPLEPAQASRSTQNVLVSPIQTEALRSVVLPATQEGQRFYAAHFVPVPLLVSIGRVTTAKTTGSLDIPERLALAHIVRRDPLTK